MAQTCRYHRLHGRWFRQLMLSMWIASLFVPAVTQETVPAPQPGPPSSDTSGPERLKLEKRIVIETNRPPASASSTNALTAERTFHWQFGWKEWDGLHVGISKKTPIQDPFGEVRSRLDRDIAQPRLHFEELKMSGKIGAKLALDGAAFVTSKDLDGFDSGVELRRARLYAKGDCLLILPVSYELEVGYIPDEFYLETSYLAFRNLRCIGELKLGQYQAPMGLDVISSTRDISLMEPAAPLQALAPGANAGVQIGHPVFNQRATWKFGLFTDGVGQDFGDASKDYGRAILRLTGLPIDRQPDHATHAAERPRLLHLDFHGFYGTVSYFLTGESRPYDRTEGCFGRVFPKRNFNWGQGGGARGKLPAAIPSLIWTTVISMAAN